jgi:hypothetical protein
MKVDLTTQEQERFYRLDGVVFRVRLDRLDQGAHYLRNGTWVWTPITSASVIQNPYSRQLLGSEAERYRTTIVI